VLAAATGKTIRTLPLPGPPAGFGDAGRLAVCFDRKEFTGWDRRPGRGGSGGTRKAAGLFRSGTFRAGDQEREYGDAVDASAVSPDGKFVAVVVNRHLLIEDEQASLYLCEAATARSSGG